ncbi:hypothetical protein [Streptomyces sp. Z26]|uniref:hypothetical protein n=1 Tax=Streptomyces sp. Z26 TaxID=2500177 RepID=UPI000FCB5825|nr:hypothetical protein [Streptomyces sp. Z26]
MVAAWWTGSRVLVTTTWEWVTADDGKERAGRLTTLAVGGALVATAGVTRAPALGWLVPAVWTLAAWAAAPFPGAEPSPEQDQQNTGEPGEQPTTEPPALPAADIVARAVREICADTAQRGVHLAHLADEIPGATKAAVRRALEDAAVPITQSLNLKHAGGRQLNRQGVLLRDLPAGLGEDPAPAPAEGPLPGPLQPPAHTPVSTRLLAAPEAADHSPIRPHPGPE